METITNLKQAIVFIEKSAYMAEQGGSRNEQIC